jgi:hypothetical protein
MSLWSFVGPIIGGILLDKAVNAVFPGSRGSQPYYDSAKAKEEARVNEYAKGLNSYFTYLESMVPTWVSKHEDTISEGYKLFYDRQQARVKRIEDMEKPKPTVKVFEGDRTKPGWYIDFAKP